MSFSVLILVSSHAIWSSRGRQTAVVISTCWTDTVTPPPVTHHSLTLAPPTAHTKKSSRYVKYFMFKQPSFLLTQTEKRAWTAQGWNLGFTCTDICAAALPSKDLLEYTDGGVSQCHFTSCNLGVGDTAGNCAGSSEWAQHGVRWGLQLCLQG